MEAANKAFNPFNDMFEDMYPKTVNNLWQDREESMVLCDFTAENWQSTRTAIPIISL